MIPSSLSTLIFFSGIEKKKEGKWEDGKKSTAVQGLQEGERGTKVTATTTTENGRRKTEETIVKIK